MAYAKLMQLTSSRFVLVVDAGFIEVDFISIHDLVYINIDDNIYNVLLYFLFNNIAVIFIIKYQKNFNSITKYITIYHKLYIKRHMLPLK